jgi:hypothetical protein
MEWEWEWGRGWGREWEWERGREWGREGPKELGGGVAQEERQVGGDVSPRWEKNSWWVF